MIYQYQVLPVHLSWHMVRYVSVQLLLYDWHVETGYLYLFPAMYME